MRVDAEEIKKDLMAQKHTMTGGMFKMERNDIQVTPIGRLSVDQS